MALPSYIKDNRDELFSSSSEIIQSIITDGSVEEAIITLSQTYMIPVADQIALGNIITFVLIGAIEPDNFITALVELVHVDGETAKKIAHDLESSLFEKARISLFKDDGVVKVLEYQGGRSKEDLRKEIMDTTKQNSALVKSPLDSIPKKTSVLTPGSRSQLLEQLQVLGSIPNDEQIKERLKLIQDQIDSLKKQEEDDRLDSKIALKSFMFGEKGKETVSPSVQPATYSVAPTQYNVDPYREIAE